jgi:hypothetical protein
MTLSRECVLNDEVAYGTRTCVALLSSEVTVAIKKILLSAHPPSSYLTYATIKDFFVQSSVIASTFLTPLCTGTNESPLSSSLVPSSEPYVEPRSAALLFRRSRWTLGLRSRGNASRIADPVDSSRGRPDESNRKYKSSGSSSLGMSCCKGCDGSREALRVGEEGVMLIRCSTSSLENGMGRRRRSGSTIADRTTHHQAVMSLPQTGKN